MVCPVCAGLRGGHGEHEGRQVAASLLPFFKNKISGGTVIFDAIAAPKISWKNIIEIFSETLKHENHVTALINNLMNVAISEKDYAASNFLQWFVNEQVEEEANVTGVLEQLKMIDGKGSALLMLDREMQQRVFVPLTAAN